MNYFVTIYTDPLLDYEGATHSFIGLTHKSPDDLENENPTWYKKIYPSINIDGNDEGFFGFGSIKFNILAVLYYVRGKVFENNHYIAEYNEEKVEVLIDSNGLVVKGGEIKSE